MHVSIPGDENVLELDKWLWLHNFANILKATESYPLKMMNLYGVWILSE